MDKTTFKIWKSTRKKLKLLAAELEVPMTALLDQLVDEKRRSLDVETKKTS